jgi:flavin-dependent dehydrogenase
MDEYDVVVVGARAAGAATAMLLARQGRRVLLLDRNRYGADTLSTHALMRGGVFLLSRWGLLDRIVAAGTPPVRRTRFDYGVESVTVTIKPTLGVEALYAPRRTVLDPVLVDAAVAAGAEVRYGVAIGGILHDGDGRVAGVEGRDRTGTAVTVRARLTVGADGIRSTVARAAGAKMLRIGKGASAVVYGYWSDLPAEGYEWFYRTGYSAGFIPTNGGEVCVFAGGPAPVTGRPDYYRLLAAATDGATGGAPDGAAGRLASARPPGRLRTWIGQPGFIRQAYGPGWALVGDAGSFLDPLSTHGITDALRDAEMLARCVDDMDQYAADRERITNRLLDATEPIASYGWDTDSIRPRLLGMNAAMNAELGLIAAGQPAAGSS